MMRLIDTSNWQGGYSVAALRGVDGIIAKATEGTGYVDSYCDSTVQQCIGLGLPWGFYHFAGNGGAVEEADFFVDNCSNYFGHGIPVLDWEGDQDVAWVNAFVNLVHERTGVWPWIYANPWRFNQGGVEPNCARWVASYPEIAHPTFEQAECWDCPSADGNVVAWQFCSDGRVDGFSGDLDCSLFYGTKEQWSAYAGNAGRPGDIADGAGAVSSGMGILENDEYKVTIERK